MCLSGRGQTSNLMRTMDFNAIRRTASLWLGPLGEPEFIDEDELDGAVADGVLLWDIRSSDAHTAWHPTGARSLGQVDWLLDEHSGANLVPSNVIASALARIGIRPGRDVIVYAGHEPVPAFIAVRALRAIGISHARICFCEDDHDHDGDAVVLARRLTLATRARATA